MRHKLKKRSIKTTGNVNDSNTVPAMQSTAAVVAENPKDAKLNLMDAEDTLKTMDSENSQKPPNYAAALNASAPISLIQVPPHYSNCLDTNSPSSESVLVVPVEDHHQYHLASNLTQQSDVPVAINVEQIAK